jgi:Tetracyclin repressor-like, C-terminal domain
LSTSLANSASATQASTGTSRARRRSATRSAPLAAAAAEEGTASERLRRWLDLLIDTKQSRARQDPELFAAYTALAAEARKVIAAHVQTLTDQLARIIADGTADGEFDVSDPETAARAVFDATSRFHNPANAAAWTDPNIDDASRAVRSLVLAGLSRHRSGSPRAPRRA